MTDGHVIDNALPRARRYYLLALLTLLMFCSYIDRFILAILVQPIKVELGLSDTRIGLLTGLAFAAVYAIAALPIARIADRGSRRMVLTLSLVAWSVMTALCGAVQSFGQLFAARMGVGVGEAGGVPASHALIASSFPLRERATAMAIFTGGAAAGLLGGFAIGSWLEAWLGWRGTFVAVGLPGLLLAVWLWLALGPAAAPRPTGDAASRARFTSLLSNRALLWLLLAQGLANLLTFGQLQWLPAFFERSFGMERHEIGTMIALSRGAGMMVGMIAGGLLADRLVARDRLAPFAVIIGAYLLAAAPTIGVYFVADSTLAFILSALAGLLAAVAMGPELATLQTIAPPEQRATVSAMSGLVSGIVGVGGGPLLVGFLSDRLAADGTDALRHALQWLTVGMMPLVIIGYVCARRASRRHPPVDQPAIRTSAMDAARPPKSSEPIK
ncbi:MFS transporter [Sphingomonas sp. YL-JM2C]